jgi:hypothetical protein
LTPSLWLDRLGYGQTLRFGGRRNSVQLLETALVVEGELQRFHFLGVESLYRKAISEWTGVTIPYSRILWAGQRSFRWVRWPLFGLFGLMEVLWLADLLFSPRSRGYEDVNWALWLIVTLTGLLLVFAIHRLALPHYQVIHRTRNRSRVYLNLQIRSKKLRRAFDRELQRNRELAARHAQPPRPTTREAS